MAKQIKDLPTSLLMNYQQVIGMANQQMDQYATQVEELVKKKEIGDDFFEETKQDLIPKFEQNNKVLEEIDQELLKRIKRDLPTITTPKIMTSLYRKFSEAKQKWDVENPKKEEGDKPGPLNLKSVK